MHISSVRCSLLAPIIFLAIFQAFLSTRAFSSNELQFEFGDSVSIYSEKAYRRDGGKIFEAIGNVIVIVGKDTLYGERVSFNIASGDVVIEGSVRYVGKSITIYGSKINYNLNTEKLVMLNSRMITPEFSIVAAEISKRSEKNYYAKNAEFTTCRDCKESWLISGKDIFLEMDKYAQIHHALIKVKGVDVVYVPYIALPIKNSRESGLLFPNVQVRSDEGAVYEQPFFWAINESQDLTFTPTFATNRGYGFDFEYRKVFGERRWMEFSNKLVFDTIYVPEQPRADSSSQFLRNFYEVENHYQFSNDFGQHLRVTGTKDLDFVRDYSFYTDNLIQETDLGASIYFDKRFEKFNLSLSSDYRRNILISDPNDFDRDYVQSLPSIDLSVAPQMVFQNDSNYFFKMNYAFDGNFTVFKQDELNEEVYLRNTNRFDSSQFLELSILNIGPITMKSKYTLDFQEYRFIDEDQDDFRKHAAILSTEMSFTIDKIFGLAYEEKYNSSEIRDADIVKIRNQAPSKNQSKLKIKKNSSLIGNLPDLESTISQNFITVSKNSYRHSQDFKLIHHRITSQGESGNERFRNQIRTNEGWFDLRDATLGDLQELEANETRRTIPLENTLEFQWNNSLIKKTPKKFNYLVDNNYLKDNFTYSKIEKWI